MDVTCVFWYGVWKIANSFDITHRNGKLHSMVSCFILLLNMWPESEWSGLKTTMIVILNLNLNILNLNFIWTRADWIQVYESCSIWESHAYFWVQRLSYCKTGLWIDTNENTFYSTYEKFLGSSCFLMNSWMTSKVSKEDLVCCLHKKMTSIH